MLQLLAAIPSLLTSISKVSELFDSGREAVQKITQQPSEASTPDELRTEIESLTPDQQNRWAEIMASKVDLYAKQNERLATEIGLVDPNITAKVNAESANKIAIMRMTTRPWTVRLMVHYILFPFYLVGIDLIQNLILNWFPILKRLEVKAFNSVEYVFGTINIPAGTETKTIEKLLNVFTSMGGGGQTLIGSLYKESIPWVVAIICGYMGLREVGKARGHKDAESPANLSLAPISIVTKALTGGVSMIDKVQSFIKVNKSTSTKPKPGRSRDH